MGVKVRQKNGKWYVFINHHGRRKAKCIGDKRAAQAVAQKLQAKLALGDFQLEDSPTPTFAAYANQWLSNAQRLCKDSTIHGYRAVIKHYLLPAFGHCTLQEITRERVRALVFDKLQAGCASQTIRNIITPLRTMLHQAVEDGIMATNPAVKIGRYLRGTPRSKDVNPLTRDEVSLLLETARTHNPRYYPFLLTACRTDMRIGELLGLQWGDIDWHGRFIEVRRARVRGRLTVPKNHKPRRVDLSEQLAVVLRILHRQRMEETLRRGWPDVPLWVFCSEKGAPMLEANVRERGFFRTLGKAGLRRVRFHDLRHTYASLLLQQGESVVYVKDQLGHSSIQITVDTYGHLIPGANKSAVDKLDDAGYDHAVRASATPAQLIFPSSLAQLG
jgi:integrase